LGMGVWGLGIGDWAQSPIPNPQSPIPNPQLKYHKKIKIIIYILLDVKNFNFPLILIKKNYLF